MSQFRGLGCPSGTRLKPGIVDGKRGFRLGPGFCSDEHLRVCASGNAAAAFTSNEYFAPGATLGLAMHTGYAVSIEVHRRDQELREKANVDVEYRYTAAPGLFLLGITLVFIGIVAHYLSSKFASANTPLRWVHYIFMASAVVVITAGVVVAATEERRVMREYNSAHVAVGYVTLVLLWLQVAAGLYIYQSESASVRLRLGHRLSGLVLVVLMFYLFISAVLKPTPLERYDNDFGRRGLMIYAIVWFVLLMVVIPIGLYDRFNSISAPTKIDLSKLVM